MEANVTEVIPRRITIRINDFERTISRSEVTPYHVANFPIEDFQS